MIRQRLRELLRNQNGYAVPEMLVSVLINGMFLTVIAAATVAIFSVQTGVKTASTSISEMSMSDLAWRADVTEAAAIQATDHKTVQFIVPHADGSCRNATWSVAANAGAYSVVRTIINYSASDAGSCAGIASTPITQTLIAATNASAEFTYRNSSGRSLTFVAGSATPDPTAAPAGTSPQRWNTEIIGGATLTAVAGATSSYPTNIYVSQTALSSIGAVAPASFRSLSLEAFTRAA